VINARCRSWRSRQDVRLIFTQGLGFCADVGWGCWSNALGDVRSERRDARWPRLVARETVITFLHERSCQRRTQVFDLPVRRMISLVPTPSALNRTISARQTCLCGALRSRASAFSRRRSAGLRAMEIPVRMRQTRIRPIRWESLPGFKCQTRSTRSVLGHHICRSAWPQLSWLIRLSNEPSDGSERSSRAAISRLPDPSRNLS